MPELVVIGGGLAGSEAAWQAAERGIKVTLYEMRPVIATGAHRTSLLAELVCSNSLGSKLINKASGLLQEEARFLGSLLLQIAEEHRLPGGSALVVDRQLFSQEVTRILSAHPNIKIIRQEIQQIPVSPIIIASGPLTSHALAENIKAFTGQENLFFYDAMAPIIHADSINMNIAFRGSRYVREETGTGDYINCPLSEEEYSKFVAALKEADRVELKAFEAEINQGVRAGSGKYFEGCLPIEVLAKRGNDALAFGPLRPVGLFDPRQRKRPYAVVQLRQDNMADTLYNLVGFQTNLTYAEQKRVFRMIPGLENAAFAHFGQMHRNTFIAAPVVLTASLQSNLHKWVFFAGQITGLEGYMGNIASGILAGINATRYLKDQPLIELPTTTMLGALCHYISHCPLNDFQPMKANFGLLPDLSKKVRSKKERYRQYVERAQKSMREYFSGADTECDV
jgi:methylenetetrahydrofolate--tRNA-(uracil-5-)-methyltransferase